MIKLSNGHELEYVVASGALGFDGQGWPWEKPLVALGLIKPELFTVAIKSLTRFPTKGNLNWLHPWTCARLLPGGGAVNKIGLTNPGFDWWCNTIGRQHNYKKFPIMISIFGEHEEDLVYMAKAVDPFDAVAIKVNVSCPNHKLQAVTQKIIHGVKAVKAVSRHPVIVKLSVVQDYKPIVAGLVGDIEAVALNSVPWETLFPRYPSPLRKLEKRVGGGGGGVSGKPAQEENWKAVKEIAEQGLVPVIAPSIMEYEDLAKVRALGASAVSFGAIHLRTPWKPTVIVRKDMQYGNSKA